MGKLDPDILTVHRIARALRIPAVDLFKTEIEMKDTRWGKPPYM
jgi:hypothetical protein